MVRTRFEDNDNDDDDDDDEFWGIKDWFSSELTLSASMGRFFERVRVFWGLFSSCVWL